MKAIKMRFEKRHATDARLRGVMFSIVLAVSYIITSEARIIPNTLCYLNNKQAL